jgi:DNA-directed RNA polymerase specialized sigma24 family protein
VLRGRQRHGGGRPPGDRFIERAGEWHAEPADARVLLGEEHAEVLAALRRLPHRQREAVILRFYLDMPEDQAAATMGVSRGTVKSPPSALRPRAGTFSG